MSSLTACQQQPFAVALVTDDTFRRRAATWSEVVSYTTTIAAAAYSKSHNRGLKGQSDPQEGPDGADRGRRTGGVRR